MTAKHHIFLTAPRDPAGRGESRRWIVQWSEGAIVTRRDLYGPGADDVAQAQAAAAEVLGLEVTWAPIGTSGNFDGRPTPTPPTPDELAEMRREDAAIARAERSMR